MLTTWDMLDDVERLLSKYFFKLPANVRIKPFDLAKNVGLRRSSIGRKLSVFGRPTQQPREKRLTVAGLSTFTASMAAPNPSHSSSTHLNAGFCSETMVYHSLRPHPPLPPETAPLSISDYVFSLLSTSSTPETAVAFIEAATGRSISFLQLVRFSKTLAASLQRRLGLTRGDSAYVISPNSVHVPVLYFALLSLGVMVSPSNPASTDSEISRQIELCKPVIAFATSSTAHKVPSLKFSTVVLDSPEFHSMMTVETETLRPIRVLQSDPATILYSSGTTGRVKGVVLSHRNWISALAGGSLLRQERASPTVTMCTVPFFHVYGFGLCLRAMALGQSIVTVERVNSSSLMKAVREFRVTNLAVAPPVIVMLANGSDFEDDCDMSSLEAVLCGGAPLSTAVIEKFTERFPNVQLAQVRFTWFSVWI